MRFQPGLQVGEIGSWVYSPSYLTKFAVYSLNETEGESFYVNVTVGGLRDRRGSSPSPPPPASSSGSCTPRATDEKSCVLCPEKRTRRVCSASGRWGRWSPCNCIPKPPESSFCGNGRCESGETRFSCTADCGCTSGTSCKGSGLYYVSRTCSARWLVGCSHGCRGGSCKSPPKGPTRGTECRHWSECWSACSGSIAAGHGPRCENGYCGCR